ncbi:MAG: MBL fold metallo-hydrolase [Pseudomonadota bacterium]
MLRTLLAALLLAPACAPDQTSSLIIPDGEVLDTGLEVAAPGAPEDAGLAPWAPLPHRDPEEEVEEPTPEDSGAPPAEEPAEGTLRLVVLDVGQGDALLLVAPDGTSLLVDAGKDGSADEIEAGLAAAGVTHLDATLVTHLHADHLGAMDEILAAHPEVRTCWDHGGSASSNAYAAYAAAAAPCRARLRTGDQPALGEGMEAAVLHPSAPSDSDENANSVVLRVRFAGVTLLLGGDCPEDGCEEALDPGDVDIYKVHHHGSAGASSAAFLARTRPELALISVGANSYGHPTEDALARLDAAGAEVHRTDEEGDLVVDVADGGWWVE